MLFRSPGPTSFTEFDSKIQGGATTTNKNGSSKPKNKSRDDQKKVLDHDSPTITGEQLGKQVHDAIMSADPNGLSAVLKNAVKAISMLKMLDNLTSPAGLSSMMSGALGSALQNIAGQIGIGNVLGALNSVMPALSGSLPTSMLDSLNSAINGMITNTPVGALTADVAAAAASVQGAISSVAQATASGNVASAINAVATIGGPAFTLIPGTLASTIALTPPGQPINTVITNNNVSSAVSIITTTPTTTGPSIPTLAGDEHINIATAAASSITNDLTSLLNITNGVPNLSNFTPAAVTNLLNNAMSNIVDQGLQTLLGSSVGNMLNNVTQLLPNIAGNILHTKNILPKTVLNPGSMISALQQSTKNLALSRLAFNISKTIFNKSNAESDSDLANNLGQLANQLSQAVSVVNAVTGSIITAKPN